MIVNVDFVKRIKDKSLLSYTEALKSSKDAGFGEIPFGEYCLAVGIVRYSEEFGVTVEACIDAVRGYTGPVAAESAVSTYAQPRRCSSCGGGRVR